MQRRNQRLQRKPHQMEPVEDLTTPSIVVVFPCTVVRVLKVPKVDRESTKDCTTWLRVVAQERPFASHQCMLAQYPILGEEEVH